jgi:hypothetical protein
MEIIYNNIFPFKGYLAMCVFPFIFVRKDARALKTTDINHETIHGRQQIETHVVALLLLAIISLVGLFPWWCVPTFPLVYFALYGLEYAFRWVIYGFDARLAYKNISFEQEAYLHEDDLVYLNNRKLFASWQYLFKTSFIRQDIGHIIVKK